MRADRGLLLWRSLRRVLPLLASTALSAFGGEAFAQNSNASNLPLLIGQGAGGTTYSVPIQTLLAFTALSFLPAVLLLMTGFTRIVIVLSLLRQALGTQSSPPNQVIVGLSLFLTLFVMGPGIKGGVYGSPPSLNLEKNQDIVFSTDFRRVYATALERWLGCPSEPVLGRAYEPLPFL